MRMLRDQQEQEDLESRPLEMLYGLRRAVALAVLTPTEDRLATSSSAARLLYEVEDQETMERAVREPRLQKEIGEEEVDVEEGRGRMIRADSVLRKRRSKMAKHKYVFTHFSSSSLFRLALVLFLSLSLHLPPFLSSSLASR